MRVVERARDPHRGSVEVVGRKQDSDVLACVREDGAQLRRILLGSAVKIVVEVPCAVRREAFKLLAGDLLTERLDLVPDGHGALGLTPALRCGCVMGGLPNRYSTGV